MNKTIRIGALISGGGTNLQAIIDACESGRIDGKMVFVGSDNPEARGLERGVKHMIPTFVVNYKSIIQGYKKNPEQVVLPDDFDMDDMLAKQSIFPDNTSAEKVRSFLITRAVAEAKLLEKMKPYPFDLLILAGFMRNFTPYFIDRINTDRGVQRIMNIHPALLPSFPGVDGYGDTFRYGCKVGGCTVHFVDYGEDSGPIIGQKAFQINEDETLDSIKAKGLKLEWELYPECIQFFAQGRLKKIRMSHTLQKGKIYQRTVVKIAQPELTA
ncbi:MAG: phosphoribosylglycinamide formyltransferase 1 [Desulfobacteraceae bacterium Eth-SRB1]|nr:MAG: phosphoribosylglycinamide formyltransferase 1 [Desulfobacteraceae bacterium Eth-SRB1]